MFLLGRGYAYTRIAYLYTDLLTVAAECCRHAYAPSCACIFYGV